MADAMLPLFYAAAMPLSCFSYYCALSLLCHAMPLSPDFGEPIFASRYAMLDAFIAYADICCASFSASDITS